MDGLVTLRPVVEDDLSWLASLRNDPTATGPHEWHGWSDPHWERRQWAESGLLGDNGGTLVVVHGTDRVGTVSWRRVQTGPTASNWALGIGLAPEFRGRGYGSEAQRLLVRYLFAHTQVNRIEATTEITNVAEQRALEKAGFTREGILRGTTFRQGRWHDQVLFSVLRDEVKLEDSAAADGLAWPEPLSEPKLTGRLTPILPAAYLPSATVSHRFVLTAASRERMRSAITSPSLCSPVGWKPRRR